MKRIIIFLTGFVLFFQSFAQPFRYAVSVFSEVDTLKAVEYATAEWLNNPIGLLSEYNIHEGENKTENRPLLMDIFTPRGDTLTRRPAIIFVHGGAFLLGTRMNDDMVALSDSFARRGYVTATIDYRLGMGASVTRFLGLIINISVTPKNALRAVYRGVQDGKAAVRYLKHNADFYGIDTTKIFMAGSSAGAFVVLHNVFYNEEGEIPPEALREPSLGGLDAIGINGYNSTADAIVSFWGAVQSIDIIKDEPTPVFLVHGEADNMVPFKKGKPLSEVVPPNPMVGFSIPETYGSYCIDSVLKDHGTFFETYFVEGQKHEFYGCNTGQFPPEGPNQYWDTIQWETSDFLQDLFRPVAAFEAVTNGLAVNFINLSSESYRAEWDFGDGNTSNKIQPIHIYSDPGVYDIHLATYNRNLACDTISKTLVVSGSVFSGEILTGNINVYPNPVKSKIFIEGFNSGFDVAISDIFGRQRIVLHQVKENSIDVGRLIPGIYFLELKSGSTKIVRKFWKVD